MSTALETYKFADQPIQVVMQNDQPWFIAKEITSALEYRMPSDATRKLDEDEKGTHLLRTPGGLQEVTIINESGLYSLILRSKKRQAKQFKRWVTHEVLPSIRKTGAYMPPEIIEQSLVNPDIMITLLQRLKDERIPQAESSESEPNRSCLAAVKYSEQPYFEQWTLTATDVAKKFDWSAQRLNKTLEELGVLYRHENAWHPCNQYEGHIGQHLQYVQYPFYKWIKEVDCYRYGLKWTVEGAAWVQNLLAKNGRLGN